MKWNTYIRRSLVTLIVFVVTITSIPLSVDASTNASTDNKYAMSYIYFGNPSKFVHAVDQTKGSLDVITPSYFDLNDDGSLLLTPALDPNFIAEMHRRKIKVVPFLSNHWNRNKGIQAINNKKVLVNQIAAAVEKYNLDGVNVNLENLTPKERDGHTELVRMLRQAIPAYKEVSVAVAANPHGWKTGWHGSYDYAGLAKASDHLFMMTYDESYQGSAAGPVASMSFVEKSIQTVVKEIPSHKLVIGIPSYGRYWKSDGTMKGYAIQHHRVESLVKQYGGQFSYDEKSNTPKAVFTIDPGDPLPTVHNIKLTPGTYTVWYDNNQSIKAKLSLVKKYNLKGAGNWSLNEETAGLWDNYTSWLHGYAYMDTKGHWAEQQISILQDKGWMTGIQPNTFGPKLALTRAQAASILVRVKGLQANKVTSSKPYWDVPASHWAANDIQLAKEAGLVAGLADGSFAPNRAVTREELAVMLTRLLDDTVQSGKSNVASFKDVSPSRWSAASIMKLAQKGIIQGYNDNTFRPANKVTRAEMAVMLHAAQPSLPMSTYSFAQKNVK